MADIIPDLVVPRTRIKAAWANKLIAALIDTIGGHAHEGTPGRGKKVNHKDLVGADQAGCGVYTHLQLDAHVNTRYSDVHARAGSNILGTIMGNGMGIAMGTANLPMIGDTFPLGDPLENASYSTYGNIQVNTGLVQALYVVASCNQTPILQGSPDVDMFPKPGVIAVTNGDATIQLFGWSVNSNINIMTVSWLALGPVP
jgi:hypothetical protein